MTNPIHPTDDHENSSSSKQESYFQGHVISVDLSKISSKEKSLEKSFLCHLSEHFSRQDNPVFSADAKHTQYLLNDFLTVGRNLGALFGVNNDTLNVVGESGGALVGTGFATLAEAREAKKVAERALDIKEQKEANLVQKIGATEVAIGVTTIGSRSLNLVSDSKGVNSAANATTSLGQATFSLGMIGGIFSSVWYGFLGFSAWGSLKEVWRVEDNLKKDGIKFLKEELNFGLDKTLEVLRKKYEKEYPDSEGDSAHLIKPTFDEFFRDILDKEAVDLAKDFLETINPNTSKTYDFQAQAEAMLKKKLNGITLNAEDTKLKELNLSPSQLLGLESLHRNRLEMAKVKLSHSIGKKALGEVFGFLEKEKPTDTDEQMVLASVNKGLFKAKTEHMIVLTFVVFGLAVAAASAVGSCIVCPPLGLIVACAVCSIALTVLISYVDLEHLLKNWNTRVGKLEEAANTTKLLLGIGCIVGICLLSGATLGTFPVAVSLVIVSSVLITSLFRYIHAQQKRKEEKEISGSMDQLLHKLEELKKNSSISKRQEAEKSRTEKKIEKIIAQKLERTHKSVLANIENGSEWHKRIIQPITSYEIEDLKKDIKNWQDAENLVIKELRESFEELGAMVETSKPLIDSLKQAFIGAPHLRRIFPEASVAS